MTFYF